MGKGRRNKVLKLTPAKVKYIIWAKINNIISKIIATEMKVGVRTVNRIWSYWMKKQEAMGARKIWVSKENTFKSSKLLQGEEILWPYRQKCVHVVFGQYYDIISIGNEILNNGGLG
jgi:hypothetical protein